MSRRRKPVNKIKLMEKQLSTPYKLGRTDCFSVVYNYMKDCGVDVPEKWNDLTMNDYVDVWKKDHRKATSLVVAFLEAFASRMKESSLLVGDILVLQHKFNKRDFTFTGIYAGNRHVMSAIQNKYVSVVRLDHYNVLRQYRIGV